MHRTLLLETTYHTWLLINSFEYLHMGPNSVSLSKEQAPVVPKVAQSYWKMKSLHMNFKMNEW